MQTNPEYLWFYKSLLCVWLLQLVISYTHTLPRLLLISTVGCVHGKAQNIFGNKEVASKVSERLLPWKGNVNTEKFDCLSTDWTPRRASSMADWRALLRYPCQQKGSGPIC